jgi:hypothetical protein
MVQRVPATRTTSAKVVLGCKDDVGLQLRRGVDTPPDEQPPAPGWIHGVGQRQPTPVVPARAFGPLPSTEPRPFFLGQGGQNRLDLAWSPAQPDVFLARDGQDISLGLGFQLQAQAPVMPIHAVRRDPLCGYAGGEGSRQHLACQLRLGREVAVRRDAGLLAAVAVGTPLLG